MKDTLTLIIAPPLLLLIGLGSIVFWSWLLGMV